MERIFENLPGGGYDILIEEGILGRLGEYAARVRPPGRAAVITDSNVGGIYGEKALKSLERAGFSPVLITVPAGEESKSPERLLWLYSRMLEAGITRRGTVFALGGGVVGDLAGFAAATLMRGIPYIQIPTTLLAQVDSSVGGKVAVNLPEGKNLAGAFYQPALVLIDPGCLSTLPDRVFSGGMAEVLKYGAISSASLFEKLAACGSREGVMREIGAVIKECCEIKSVIVARDERDSGERMLLNFGHTLGHVYEAAYGYGRYTHGEAVAAGMCAITRLAESAGRTPPGVLSRLMEAAELFGLPTGIPFPEGGEKMVMRDKKAGDGEISLVFLSDIGRGNIEKMEISRFVSMITELVRNEI